MFLAEASLTTVAGIGFSAHLFSSSRGHSWEERTVQNCIWALSRVDFLFCFCFGEQICGIFQNWYFGIWCLLGQLDESSYICSLAVCAYWLQQSFNTCTAAAYASWLSCFCKALINRPSKMKPQLLAPGVVIVVFLVNNLCHQPVPNTSLWSVMMN